MKDEFKSPIMLVDFSVSLDSVNFCLIYFGSLLLVANKFKMVSLSVELIVLS